MNTIRRPMSVRIRQHRYRRWLESRQRLRLRPGSIGHQAAQGALSCHLRHGAGCQTQRQENSCSQTKPDQQFHRPFNSLILRFEPLEVCRGPNNLVLVKFACQALKRFNCGMRAITPEQIKLEYEIAGPSMRPPAHVPTSVQIILKRLRFSLKSFGSFTIRCMVGQTMHHMLHHEEKQTSRRIRFLHECYGRVGPASGNPATF